MGCRRELGRGEGSQYPAQKRKLLLWAAEGHLGGAPKHRFQRGWEVALTPTLFESS